jgi:D-3-phosphoglycerate dehydrogenase
MADISNVDNSTIKDLYERLESLSCTIHSLALLFEYGVLIAFFPARIMTRILY